MCVHHARKECRQHRSAWARRKREHALRQRYPSPRAAGSVGVIIDSVLRQSRSLHRSIVWFSLLSDLSFSFSFFVSTCSLSSEFLRGGRRRCGSVTWEGKRRDSRPPRRRDRRRFARPFRGSPVEARGTRWRQDVKTVRIHKTNANQESQNAVMIHLI